MKAVTYNDCGGHIRHALYDAPITDHESATCGIVRVPGVDSYISYSTVLAEVYHECCGKPPRVWVNTVFYSMTSRKHLNWFLKDIKARFGYDIRVTRKAFKQGVHRTVEIVDPGAVYVVDT